MWTTAERIGMKKGMKKGKTKMLLRQIEQADILAVEDRGVRLISANSREEVC
jgi:hypothetical protein